MKKTVLLALVVLIAAFSPAVRFIGVDASYAQSAAVETPSIESLLSLGESALEEGKWGQAGDYFDKALEINPEYAQAYFGKLLMELKIKSEADLENYESPLDDMLNYQNTLQFADESYRAKVTGYNQAIKMRIQERERQQIEERERQFAEGLRQFNEGGRQIGSVISFGGFDWRVIDVQDGRALIITKDAIEQRQYNEAIDEENTGEGVDVTWETCTLRKYLNGEFYSKLTKEEQEFIAETRIQNPDNVWYGTNGGNDTTDNIFLLSLEEVDKYFGDSGDYREKRRKNFEWDYPVGKFVTADDGYYFSNTNDSDRIAKFSNEYQWWWLRTPGIRGDCAANTGAEGFVYIHGDFVGERFLGVRPVLWLNL